MSLKLAKKRIKKLEEENEALKQMLEEISKLNLIGQTIKILEEPKKPKKQRKKDPRITVTREEDRTEYYRQYGYISRNPDCEVIPPRQYKTHQSDRNIRNLNLDPRITVTRKEDSTEYNRQYCYLVRNPDCKEIPPRERCIRGKDYPDPRVTVQRRENRAEYARQLAYIKRNPDCKEVPPKQLTFLC